MTSARGLALGVALALLGCEDPPLDDPRPGGAALPPTGAITGTVQYAGPRPPCAPGDDGVRRPVGRVVLTLFAFDDPPPPEGTARSALNLLTVPGGDLFQAPGDCLPEDATPEQQAVVIVRSAPFAWPELALGAAYQIRGFYDADGDFVPFFPESSQPTAGDVAGGAVDPIDRSFLRIVFPPAAEAPEGAVRAGVSVNLAAPVWSERPIFSFQDPLAALPADTTFPALPPGPAFEDALYDAAGLTLSLVDPGPPPAAPDEPWLLPPDATDFVDAAAELAVSFDPRWPGYAWFLEPLDLDGDGATDELPVLPGVPWYAPILQLNRVPGPGEAALGVPPVTLFGSIRTTRVADGKRVAKPDLDVLVVPVGVVDLVPGDPACTVPFIPPGNFRETYEDGPRDCQKLPTGAYAVTALQGVAGGTGLTPVDPMDVPSVTDTGFVVDGASLATQSWTVPNPLGAPGGDATPVPGQATPFFVHDPTPEDGVGADAPGCAMAFSPVTMDVAPITFAPVPGRCCEPVRPLCDLPLCDAVEVRDGVAIRAPNGDTPCTPFPPPRSCCPATPE